MELISTKGERGTEWLRLENEKNQNHGRHQKFQLLIEAEEGSKDASGCRSGNGDP